jgi:hypothetical protein
MSSVVKRFSLLRRNAALTRAAFSRHYRDVHGPLAAAQAGFRKFAYRYDQNHVEADLFGGDDPPFDGVTVTFQVPRSDYRTGFFQHPDYANVRPDEERLFDLSRTVSLLGTEQVLKAGAGRAKAIVICRQALAGAAAGNDPDPTLHSEVRAIIRNDLDFGSASALGAGPAPVEYGHLWEIWFGSPEARTVCLGDPAFRRSLSRGDEAEATVALAVRDITIFK